MDETAAPAVVRGMAQVFDLQALKAFAPDKRVRRRARRAQPGPRPLRDHVLQGEPGGAAEGPGAPAPEAAHG